MRFQKSEKKARLMLQFEKTRSNWLDNYFVLIAGQFLMIASSELQALDLPSSSRMHIPICGAGRKSRCSLFETLRAIDLVYCRDLFPENQHAEVG